MQAQLEIELESQRKCGVCGQRRWVKEKRQVWFKSLFGGITIAIPRLEACGCARSSSKTGTLAVPGLKNWVAPELEYVHSRLAAELPYAKASNLLTLLLPVDAGNSTSTVHRRTLEVGQRLDAQMMETEAEPEAPNGPDSVVSMGLDSGYVRSCSPRSERSLEVVVARILGRASSSRSLGFVRKTENNEQVRQRIRCCVARQGATTDRLTVFTDGDPGFVACSSMSCPTPFTCWIGTT